MVSRASDVLCQLEGRGQERIEYPRRAILLPIILNDQDTMMVPLEEETLPPLPLGLVTTRV